MQRFAGAVVVAVVDAAVVVATELLLEAVVVVVLVVVVTKLQDREFDASVYPVLHVQCETPGPS